MGDENKKGGGGFFKKLVITLIVLPVLAYAGWFGYAKATGNADT
jgi:hypothetical protein